MNGGWGMGDGGWFILPQSGFVQQINQAHPQINCGLGLGDKTHLAPYF